MFNLPILEQATVIHSQTHKKGGLQRISRLRRRVFSQCNHNRIQKLIMKGKRIKYAIGLVVLIFIGYLVLDALSIPGVNDLKGGFREVAVFRNENNTGPIVRIYAVTVKAPTESEMKTYGDLMPYTKYGTTRVYFFKEGSPSPTSISREEPNFSQDLDRYCIAKYDKNAMAQVTFSLK